MPFPSLNPTPPEGSALRRALIRLSSARKETLPPVFRETGGRVFTDDLSEIDRFSETPPFCISLKSNFEAAFWDTSESFLFERDSFE